ncbi:hypothetical protein H4S02_001505 [Coemansia sp. RSA 2611]|nr:hypothetical protein H4S02_001505 [Coemansia sp. RSA 2611]
MFLIHLVQGAKALAKAAGAKASAAANKPRAVVRKAVHGLRAKGSGKSAGRRLSTDSTATTVMDCLAADAPEIDDAEHDFTASMATLTGPDATIPDDLIEEIDAPEEGANSAISTHETDPQPVVPAASPVAANNASADTPIRVFPPHTGSVQGRIPSDKEEGEHSVFLWLDKSRLSLKREKLRAQQRAYRTVRIYQMLHDMGELGGGRAMETLLGWAETALALTPYQQHVLRAV